MKEIKGKKLAVILGAIALLVLILVGVWSTSGIQVSKVRCVVADNGTLFMVYENRPVVLNGIKEHEFQTGDMLLVCHAGAFAESYPEQVKAYKAIRLKQGTKEDVPKEVLDILIEMDYLAPFAKEGFSFSFTFGYYGCDFYDSSTGELIKDEQHSATMQLSEEAFDEIYKLICDLDIQSYPDEYDPTGGFQWNSLPPTTYILTVYTNDWTKTVTCEKIPTGAGGYDEASKDFMNAMRVIQIKIKSTKEWQEFPETGHGYM